MNTNMENNEKKRNKVNAKATPWAEERFGLLKIDDAILLRESQKQLGMAKSYIQELEDSIKELQLLIQQLQKGENKDFRKEIKRDELYQQIQNDNKALREKNKKLKAAYDIALSRLYQAERNGNCA